MLRGLPRTPEFSIKPPLYIKVKQSEAMVVSQLECRAAPRHGGTTRPGQAPALRRILGHYRPVPRVSVRVRTADARDGPPERKVKGLDGKTRNILGSRNGGLVYDIGLMGRNKDMRKKIDGHRRMVREHLAKIEHELQSTSPPHFLMSYWEKRVHEVELRILRLEEELRQH